VTRSETNATWLRPVSSDHIQAALEDALSGGAAVAPLPESGVERRLSLEMLAIDQPVVEPDAAAVVATSGSTGKPKGVVLSRSAIAASVSATHVRLGGPGAWVLAIPAHYVAGLMVVARTVLARTALRRVATDLSDLPSAAGQLTGRRYLSLIPTQLVRACADPLLSEVLSDFDVVLLGGAAADPRLLAQARDRGITVVTTYGMSETCGGCVYDGAALDTVEVDLEPDTGRILLGGPTLFSGYRLRPDLTERAFDRGFFVTQDRGRWRRGRLEVAGRLDDIVVSGGVNVDLGAVERAAQAWPGLNGAEIAVVGIPHVEWGTQVVAVTDGSGSVDELRRYLRRAMPVMAAPRRVARVNALPRTSGGKIDRQRLIADLAATLDGEVFQ
jgi:O-succinylbenzoic acid--CoA ligase